MWLFFGTPCFAHAAPPLTFTPLPLTNPERVVAESRNLAEHVSMLLGRNVQIRYEQDYATILELFAQDEIDLVQLGPLPFVTLRGMAPQAEPLVFFRNRDGRTDYSCALVTAMDTAEDLSLHQGPIALTQPLSTCGYLATAILLEQMGQSLGQLPHAYLGSHEAVALAVIRGEYSLGGLRASYGESYAQIGLRILERTQPLPEFVFVANSRTLDRKTLEKLTRDLVAIPAETLRHWVGLGRWGMTPAHLEDFCGLHVLLTRQTSIRDRDGPLFSLFENSLEEACSADP
ncbi:hypothetical protein JCM31598_19530 [Desulfonatronum parangueonense]